MGYRIKCVNKDTGEVYYAYNGHEWDTFNRAESERSACELFYGDKITYEIESVEE